MSLPRAALFCAFFRAAGLTEYVLCEYLYIAYINIISARTHTHTHTAATQPKPITVKGKAVPLQAWSGPEGSSKLRFSDFMTAAQDGGKVVSLTHRPPLPQGNTPGTHFC